MQADSALVDFCDSINRWGQRLQPPRAGNSTNAHAFRHARVEVTRGVWRPPCTPARALRRANRH